MSPHKIVYLLRSALAQNLTSISHITKNNEDQMHVSPITTYDKLLNTHNIVLKAYMYICMHEYDVYTNARQVSVQAKGMHRDSEASTNRQLQNI